MKMHKDAFPNKTRCPNVIMAFPYNIIVKNMLLKDTLNKKIAIDYLNML